MGAWIEILSLSSLSLDGAVAPLVGAWIEMHLMTIVIKGTTKSLLSWERGLKSNDGKNLYMLDRVAPLVGAWIEIGGSTAESTSSLVAPLVGAWIEIDKC